MLWFVQGHVRLGYEILQNLDFRWPVADTVLQHHERMDGSGYPNGIRGADLLLEARILMVADVVEAMMWQRPYRPALGAQTAILELQSHAGSQFDQEVVAACAHLLLEKSFEFFDASTP